MLTIQYQNGIAQLPLPNDPFASTSVFVNGKTLTVSWSYDTTNEEVRPTLIELFIWPVNGNADYDCPAGRSVLGQPVMRWIFGDVSATACYDGVYFFGLKALGPNGVSLGTQFYGPVVLSDQAQSSPVSTNRQGI